MNNDIEFLEALSKLPIIRKNIIKIVNDIIHKAKNKNQEDELIEEKTLLLLNDLKANNLYRIDEDVNLLEPGIKSLITTQIPLSKLANKIRKLKDNPPSSFQ